MIMKTTNIDINEYVDELREATIDTLITFSDVFKHDLYKDYKAHYYRIINKLGEEHPILKSPEGAVDFYLEEQGFDDVPDDIRATMEVQAEKYLVTMISDSFEYSDLDSHAVRVVNLTLDDATLMEMIESGRINMSDDLYKTGADLFINIKALFNMWTNALSSELIRTNGSEQAIVMFNLLTKIADARIDETYNTFNAFMRMELSNARDMVKAGYYGSKDLDQFIDERKRAKVKRAIEQCVEEYKTQWSHIGKATLEQLNQQFEESLLDDYEHVFTHSDADDYKDMLWVDAFDGLDLETISVESQYEVFIQQDPLNLFANYDAVRDYITTMSFSFGTDEANSLVIDTKNAYFDDDEPTHALLKYVANRYERFIYTNAVVKEDPIGENDREDTFQALVRLCERHMLDRLRVRLVSDSDVKEHMRLAKGLAVNQAVERMETKLVNDFKEMSQPQREAVSLKFREEIHPADEYFDLIVPSYDMSHQLWEKVSGQLEMPSVFVDELFDEYVDDIGDDVVTTTEMEAWVTSHIQEVGTHDMELFDQAKGIALGIDLHEDAPPLIQYDIEENFYELLYIYGYRDSEHDLAMMEEQITSIMQSTVKYVLDDKRYKYTIVIKENNWSFEGDYDFSIRVHYNNIWPLFEDVRVSAYMDAEDQYYEEPDLLPGDIVDASRDHYLTEDVITSICDEYATDIYEHLDY